MKKSSRPFTSKLRPEMEPSVVQRPDGAMMLLPTPLLVARVVRRVPHGKWITPAQIRARLARQFQADTTCPLMTGIFLSLLAGAAEEELAAGRTPTAPYWRVVQDDGTLSEKFPPGPAQQARRLAAEGHRVLRTGAKKRYTVAAFLTAVPTSTRKRRTPPPRRPK